MGRYNIAVPNFPGSNGYQDAADAISDFGMNPVLIYFQQGHSASNENARRLIECDGAIIPGGFPEEDRGRYGIFPSENHFFRDSIFYLANKKNAPILGFCSGNQVGHAMGLVLPEGSNHRVSMEHNIYDRDGNIVRNSGFIDSKPYAKLQVDPRRTAFTRHMSEGQIIQSVISNGGGRVDMDNETLDFLLKNGQIIFRYCDSSGNIDDNFPINPTGSLLNIDAISNYRGNVLLQMMHHERVLNAMADPTIANLMIDQMGAYIEDGCPDLSSFVTDQREFIDINKRKNFSYLKTSDTLKSDRSIDIEVRMKTQDNERNSVSLFFNGMDVERRRLIRVGVKSDHYKRGIEELIVRAIAEQNSDDAIMVAKDDPRVRLTDGVYSLSEFGDFKKEGMEMVEGYSSRIEQVPEVDQRRVDFMNRIIKNATLQKGKERISLSEAVSHVELGTVWYFRNQEDADRMRKVFFD